MNLAFLPFTKFRKVSVLNVHTENLVVFNLSFGRDISDRNFVDEPDF